MHFSAVRPVWHLERSIYLLSILDKSSGLLFDARHVRLRRVDQSGDLGRPDEAVQLRPAQVQARSVQVGVNGPVSVGGSVAAILHVSLFIAELLRELDRLLNILDLWRGQEVYHVGFLEKMVVTLQIFLDQRINSQAVLFSIVRRKVVRVQGVVPSRGTLGAMCHSVICRGQKAMLIGDDYSL